MIPQSKILFQEQQQIKPWPTLARADNADNTVQSENYGNSALFEHQTQLEFYSIQWLPHVLYYSLVNSANWLILVFTDWNKSI